MRGGCGAYGTGGADRVKLSLGKAAAVAGLSYRAFYDLLRRYDVPVVTMTEDDVRREVEYARKHL
ncbi:MAG: UPF0175 family protein [Spirochaetaceae bacterium]|nr:UPF0175 family protein [Spirochaetaceae bacterium]